MRQFYRFVCGVFLLLAFSATSVVAQYPKPEPVPPKQPKMNASGLSGDWQKLAKVGPGHSAAVTLRDGTLRTGWIAGVDEQNLRLLSTGETVELGPSEISMVRVHRSDRTLLYGLIGYLVTATTATILVHNDGYHELKDLSIVFGVAGIPGGLLGALLGEWTSGDVDIVP